MPILIDQPLPGVAIAQLLDGFAHQATGVSVEQAMRMLKRGLAKEIKQQRISTLPTWREASLAQRRFTVQPAIIYKERRYPAGPSVALPVRYIELTDTREQLYCMLPDFGEVLYIPERALLKTILSETVRSVTAILAPRELHRLWPPATSELRWMRVALAEPRRYGGGPSTKTLSGVAEALTDGRNLAIAPGSRDKTLKQLRDAISKGSCLVVGETGVGKTTLISSIAREMFLARRAERKQQRERGAVPQPLTPMFWSSSGGRLIAGMRYLGQWQQRLESVVAELADLDGVLVIENLLDLLSVGGREPRDSLAAFLIPYIRSGSLRLVAEATPTELDACRRLLPALVDALPNVLVAPLGVAHEQELLRITLTNRLRSADIPFDPGVPACISQLCRQFQRQGAAPGPAMRFLQSLSGRKHDPALSRQWSIPWILENFSRRTGLPLALLDDTQTLAKADVIAELQREVIGQEEACRQVAGTVTRIKSALQDPRRPFGCLLLCGPTGVGKTQLAKSLGKYLFGAAGEKTPLIRLDMSEYAGASAGFRFLNDAQGNSASWIQQIRSRPLSVLLLDEVEKASTEVFDILLSVLDEGRLTDRLGRVTSFRNSVVIMTSNVGARSSTALGFGDDLGIDYAGEVRKAFRPEFFNRLDSVIAFLPLQKAVIRRISEKELGDLRHREGLERYGRKIEWTEALLDHLARAGFQASLGARPLQRTIETDIVAPLSKWIVEHSDS
ncbi:MAG: ATP-dependent Clp protease ATP-binding subunit, partial [Planctomycetales bacterium]|nr:ATP-dependent Clp protease ATP-binding subunit [Planctomycetales bacterium]